MSKMIKMPEYSIVIPIYNEEDNIKLLAEGIVNAMDSISESYEVILVDDGSDDRSNELLKELCAANRKFTTIVFQQNCGQTAAFDAGFKKARGKIVITLDADLQYDPMDISLLLPKLGEYDVVCGYRKKRADSWVKRISSKIANFARNRLSGENVRDTGCSLKAFKKECLQNLKLYEGMHRFFPTLLKMEGYKITEVPVSHFPRKYGVSKYNIHNRLFKSFKDLIAVRWMQKRYLNYKIVNEYSAEKSIPPSQIKGLEEGGKLYQSDTATHSVAKGPQPN